jgi:dihydropteroate synthase
MNKVRLMGILNITPDSFYINSRFLDYDTAVKRGIEIYKQGADIIGNPPGPGRIQYLLRKS